MQCGLCSVVKDHVYSSWWTMTLSCAPHCWSYLRPSICWVNWPIQSCTHQIQRKWIQKSFWPHLFKLDLMWKFQIMKTDLLLGVQPRADTPRLVSRQQHRWTASILSSPHQTRSTYNMGRISHFDFLFKNRRCYLYVRWVICAEILGR